MQEKYYNIKFKELSVLFFNIPSDNTTVEEFVEKMKNMIKKIATYIQEERYMRYVQKHRIRMSEAYEEMLTCPEITNLGNEILIMLKQRVVFHDITKFKVEEFDAYRKNFFPISQREKKDNLDNFEKAWQHHYDNNPHHWQHRRNNTEFNKNNPEQVVNVLENVCDWLAVGYTYKNRPYQYYEKHKEKIELCPEEKEFFEYIIYSLENKNKELQQENNKLKSLLTVIIQSLKQFFRKLLKLGTENDKDKVVERAKRLFIGVSRSSICQILSLNNRSKDKRILFEKIMSYDIWKEIASSYPIKKLPLYPRLFLFGCITKKYYFLSFLFSVKKALQ